MFYKHLECLLEWAVSLFHRVSLTFFPCLGSRSFHVVVSDLEALFQCFIDMSILFW